MTPPTTPPIVRPDQRRGLGFTLSGLETTQSLSCTSSGQGSSTVSKDSNACKHSQFESTLAATPYHRHNTVLSNVAPTIQLGEIVVYLLTIRDERLPTVDTRHQNRFHCTNLCILRQISRVVVCKETSVSNSCVTSWHRVHSSSQQSKLAFRVSNVTTLLHVEQGRSSPILFADQTLIQV